MGDCDDIEVIPDEPEADEVTSPLLANQYGTFSINSTPSGVRSPFFNRQSVSSLHGYQVINNSNNVPQDPNVEELNSRVAVSLYICKRRVLRPYRRLLLVVGWQPLFDDADTACRKILNVLHPALVMALVLLGYILQYASCFRRDSAILPKLHTIHIDLIYTGNTTGDQHVNDFNMTSCSNSIFSQFILPDIFHSAAYLYSFYLLRFKESEHLLTLVERTFLHTSQSDTFYFLSQGKLIRSMRFCLYISVIWVAVSLTSQVLHVSAVFNDINFRFMMHHCTTNCSGDVKRIVLIAIMMVSFVALDVVYVVVVMNYCIQSLLLIFYIEGLQEKVRQRLITFQDTYKDIANINGHLTVLNYNTALALSIVLFNFGAMTLEGAVSLIIHHKYCSWLPVISTCLSVLNWLFMIVYPLLQACQLSGSCNALRKLGHEICIRPFRYQDTPQADLDSFLLYTSTLNMRAKIFMVPVRTSYVCCMLTAFLFMFIILLQTNVIPINF